MRTFVRHVRESIAARDITEASERLRRVTRVIDKAVSKGVLHRNTASRKISRLTLAVKKLAASG